MCVYPWCADVIPLPRWAGQEATVSWFTSQHLNHSATVTIGTLAHQNVYIYYVVCGAQEAEDETEQEGRKEQWLL